MTEARSVDDFAEFLTSAYQPVTDVFTTQGLKATIQAGVAGHYLIVAQQDDSSLTGDQVAVEITAANKPLPDNPADVSEWTVTCRGTSVSVSASPDLNSLVSTVVSALHHC